MIYGDFPEEFKSTLKSCKKSIQATSEFIRRECETKPIKSEKSGRSYKTFNKKDMRKIYNRVVLKYGVYDVMAGNMIEFDEKLPYYYEIKAKYISKESSKLNTPYFDKLLKDATGGDKDSIQMIVSGQYGELLKYDMEISISNKTTGAKIKDLAS